MMLSPFALGQILVAVWAPGFLDHCRLSWVLDLQDRAAPG